MQAVIYASLRNGERDQRIHDALVYKHVVEVAKEFQLAPNTIRAAAKRIQNAVVFDLCLLGGGAANAYWQSCRGLFQESSSWRLPKLPRHLPQP
ncbi:hypothetical protein [Pseudomonas tolaasii]|uniref:hypothetical protein n=1 Tax=Pseudomonas tolaasii TaxID=29442 RepID=UPI00035E658E|nr:hypothetical protein [Pseudomonas tolaasii]QXQ16665.1 hypothetical protein I7845_17330 [Pseudomonas tolaasii]